MEPFTAISCDGTTNVTVEGNFIHDNYFSTYRIWVGKGNELPDVSTILINDNCIAGNPRWLINIVSSQLDATGNWGAHDGPSPPGSGDSVEGNVNVADFLTNEPKECKRECITIWLLQARAGLCQQEQARWTLQEEFLQEVTKGKDSQVGQGKRYRCSRCVRQ
jgi:hypothetical protein